MKKIKQVLAILGILILLSLYIITLGMALFDNPDTMKMFHTSIVATTIIPVLLWTYSFIYKLIKKDDDDTTSPS